MSNVSGLISIKTEGLGWSTLTLKALMNKGAININAINISPRKHLDGKNLEVARNNPKFEKPNQSLWKLKLRAAKKK